MKVIDRIVSHGTSEFGEEGRVHVFKKTYPTLIGGGAGAAVTQAVVFDEPMPNATYIVAADAEQDAVCYPTSKTVNGFTLNILPRLAANTLAAGFVTVLVQG